GYQFVNARLVRTAGHRALPGPHQPVMPGLAPGIHGFLRRRKDVDGRDEPGHDEGNERARPQSVVVNGSTFWALRMKEIITPTPRMKNTACRMCTPYSPSPNRLAKAQPAAKAAPNTSA